MVNRFSAVISTVQGYRFVMALRGLRNVGRGEDFVASFTGAEARSYLEYVIWHQSGTAALCALVATMMGLTAPEVREALQGALMHDVGKFLVPSDCLWKAGRLSVLERDTLARHTTAGADFLAQRGFSQGVVLAARHHHERWDGKGYPDGLKGEKIPLTARIVAACDALDAMTEGRHYARKRPLWDIASEFEAGAGSQFDPVVAGLVLEFLGRKGEFACVQNWA